MEFKGIMKNDGNDLIRMSSDKLRKEAQRRGIESCFYTTLGEKSVIAKIAYAEGYSIARSEMGAKKENILDTIYPERKRYRLKFYDTDEEQYLLLTEEQVRVFSFLEDYCEFSLTEVDDIRFSTI